MCVCDCACSCSIFPLCSLILSQSYLGLWPRPLYTSLALMCRTFLSKARSLPTATIVDGGGSGGAHGRFSWWQSGGRPPSSLRCAIPCNNSRHLIFLFCLFLTERLEDPSELGLNFLERGWRRARPAVLYGSPVGPLLARVSPPYAFEKKEQGRKLGWPRGSAMSLFGGLPPYKGTSSPLGQAIHAWAPSRDFFVFLIWGRPYTTRS